MSFAKSQRLCGCGAQAVAEIVAKHWKCARCAMILIQRVSREIHDRNPLTDPAPGDVVVAKTGVGIAQREVKATTPDTVTHEDATGKTRTIKLETWRQWCRVKNAAATQVAFEPNTSNR